MDGRNRFETPVTLAHNRVEWGVGLGVSIGLALAHLGDINWVIFVGLFVIIDLIGYIPGAIAFRRTPGGRIPRPYFILYNTMHSLVTWSVILGAWLLVFGFQWALLAVPIHLLGDRALFGNTLKPFRVPFEPHLIPAFQQFEIDYAAMPLAHSVNQPNAATSTAGRNRRTGRGRQCPSQLTISSGTSAATPTTPAPSSR